MSGYAKTLGLDTTRFDKCLTDAPGQSIIDADTALAGQVGVNNPPYWLLLNPVTQSGTRVQSISTLDKIDKPIQDLLAAPATPTPAK